MVEATRSVAFCYSSRSALIQALFGNAALEANTGESGEGPLVGGSEGLDRYLSLRFRVAI